MIIKTLTIQHFRNIQAASLDLSPFFNIFCGQNGSGKTSLLEAMYYLGLSKSFRTSNLHSLIQEQCESCHIVAILQDQNRSFPLGIERNRLGQRTLRKDGENVSSILALAQELPLQIITADSHTLFTEGPKLRRQFFDWGLFHVEPRFYFMWQQLQKILKQRNSGLKARLSAAEIKAWDHELVRLAEDIDLLRIEHLALLKKAVSGMFAHLLPEVKLEINYYRGWEADESLNTALEQGFYRDLQLGYTQIGPQRADLGFTVNATPIQDYLSQGQLKLAAYALRLSQGRLLQTETGKSAIYLIDDLPSELDQQKRHLIIQTLSELQAQTFITGISPEDLKEITDLPKARLFHVKQGMVREVECDALTI